MRRTRKERGGNIKSDVFSKILSIGYELETAIISKLSLIDNNTLLNTDTVSNDLEKIFGQKGGENGDSDVDVDEEEEAEEEMEEEEMEEDDEAQYENRKKELVEFDAYTNESFRSPSSTLTKDPNTKFYVLNDITESKFNKSLYRLCKDHAEATIAMAKAEQMENDDQYDEEIDGKRITLDYKNQLYTFDTTTGNKSYNINFEAWTEKDCGTFADVEWVFTYYKPEQSKNVILDTFTNVIKNLAYHMDRLEPIPGKLVVHFDKDDKEVLSRPVERILYHYPNTNMYYLQTHQIDEQLTMNDVCIVPQMTFSCNIKYFIPIAKELIRDSLKIYPRSNLTATTHLRLIQNLEKCVNQLFDAYNAGAEEQYRLGDAECINNAKNYLFLILYKISRYYYFLKHNKSYKYFKDSLFFNSRHYNIEIYEKLKEVIGKCINSGDPGAVAKIIQKIVAQPSILEKYMVESVRDVRKNAFHPNNILDKSNSNYGNPHYSLISYFQFFEDPVDADDKDWLVYNNIDVFSTTMRIKEDVILTELRYFKYALNIYMGSIADEELKREITQGACNRITNVYSPELAAYSMTALKRFAEIYDQTPMRSMSRRTSATKKARSLRTTRRSRSQSSASRSNKRSTIRQG